MLHPYRGNTWGYRTGNATDTRPQFNLGSSISPGANNAYGSYASILTGGNIAQDCYLVCINVNSGATNGQAKDTLITIGVDSSGGTNYQTLIPDLLSAGSSGASALFCGYCYIFPIYVKAGSQLAAKAQVNNGTGGTVRLVVELYGAPSAPEAILYGTSVEAVGVTAASSSGVSVTAGTTSPGSWVSIGSLSARCFYYQIGVGCNNSAASGPVYFCDLAAGDGTSYLFLQPRSIYRNDSSEAHSLIQFPSYSDLPAGTNLYGRMQCSGTAESGLSMAAYGVRF